MASCGGPDSSTGSAAGGSGRRTTGGLDEYRLPVV